MNNILNKLLENITSLVDFDLTCLIKSDGKSFRLLEQHTRENLTFDLNSINDNIENSDFAVVHKKLLDINNLSSYLLNKFSVNENNYFVFTASKLDNYSSEEKKNIHAKISQSIKELLLLLETDNNALENQPDCFTLFAEGSGELVFTLDQIGEFTYVNSAGLNWLKYTNDEIIGMHFFELIADDYKLRAGEVFQKILAEKNKITFNAEVIPKVSIEQLFNLRLIPVMKDGKLNKLLGIGTNISLQNNEKKKNDELLAKLKEANRINAIERDRAKQQISILSELNTLKNEFISNVSHELRTPLASIIGFSETILDDKNLTIERAKEFNDVILSESKRLAKLINDVLDFSELENEKQHLEKSSTNIIDIFSDCLNSFKDQCENKKITLTDKVPESEIIVFADKERLKKAFNYLLSNAVKFTNENGRITLMAQEFLKEVEIVISDTGVGISEQKLPLLFDKFSKVTREGKHLPGAGFGLVTVKQIIDLHKGLIKVKSEVDRGTSFIIRLPKYSFN